MPVTFTAANTLADDPHVRAANAYQGALDYATNRLSAANLATLLADLTAGGLPTDSSDVLNLPNPFEYVAGVRTIVMRFVSQFPINPSTISTTSPVFAGALTVTSNLTVNGTAAITGNSTITNNLLVNGVLTANAGAISLGNSVAVTGSGTFGGGVRVGSLTPFPGAGQLIADDTIQAKNLILTGQINPGSAANGTFAEDSNGDIYYKNQSGNTAYLNRPTHDTGWLDGSTADALWGTQGLGQFGGLAPNPLLVPDLYGATPLTLAGDVGDTGGATKIVVWVRADESLIDGGAVTGVFRHIQVNSFETGGNLGGVSVIVDQNRNLAVTLGTNLVAGQPLITSNATAALVDVRIMVWTR